MTHHASRCPACDRLGELIEQVRAAGLPVELSIEGDRRPLDAGIELSAYRIVQEALTNALKHASGARARVRMRYERTALEIEVTDEGGSGLARPRRGGDRRPRADRHAGACRAVRRRTSTPARHAGGFRVRARLPIESEPVAAS